MMRCSLVKVATRAPNDVQNLKKRMEDLTINPNEVVAVLGKTEGNGCVNDFTRGFAVQALTNVFESYRGEQSTPISYVMSGGTEGVLSPHLSIISRGRSMDGKSGKREQASLAIGVARTTEFQPEELGRLIQVDQVAEAVNGAIREAGIERPEDVHFVQIKCPLLTAEQIQSAHDREVSIITEDTYKSMGFSRGASALGAAVALGEIDRTKLQESDICHAWELYSNVASTSAGSELAYCEVIVFGNSYYAEGPYFIDHDVMKDAIDVASFHRIVDKYPDAELIQVLAKAEADPTGYVRGQRHTMLDDSDINHTRHARAVVGGVLASVSGDGVIYVSGGAEHQGPAGGGPIAIVFKRQELDHIDQITNDRGRNL